jgi:hypothetical protein
MEILENEFRFVTPYYLTPYSLPPVYSAESNKQIKYDPR